MYDCMTFYVYMEMLYTILIRLDTHNFYRKFQKF